MKRFGFVSFLVALVLVAGATLLATDYTVKLNQVNANSSPNFLSGTHTWLARTDTATFTWRWANSGRAHQTVGQLYTYVQRATEDSTVDLAVRYQVSSDGANWQTFTLGTDSTTWAVAAALNAANDSTDGTWQLLIFDIEQATHGGVGPYARVKAWGRDANNGVGTRFRLDAIDQ